MCEVFHCLTHELAEMHIPESKLVDIEIETVRDAPLPESSKKTPSKKVGETTLVEKTQEQKQSFIRKVVVFIHSFSRNLEDIRCFNGFS